MDRGRPRRPVRPRRRGCARDRWAGSTSRPQRRARPDRTAARMPATAPPQPGDVDARRRCRPAGRRWRRRRRRDPGRRWRPGRTDPLHLAQEVGVQDDRRAPRAGIADDRPDLVTADGVEGRRRLVEDHEVRIAEERDREPETLRHALGEPATRRPRGLRCRPRSGRACLLGSTGSGQVRELGVDAGDLPCGQPARVAEQLGQIADPPTCLEVTQGSVEDAAVPGCRTSEPEQQLDGGRLAGAVGPEQPEDLAASMRRSRPSSATVLPYVLRSARVSTAGPIAGAGMAEVWGCDTGAVTGRAQGAWRDGRRTCAPADEEELRDVLRGLPGVRRAGRLRPGR